MAETRTPDLFDRLLARTGAVHRPDAVVALARPRPAMPFERLPAAAPAETETEAESDAEAAPSRPGPEASAALPATTPAGPREAPAPRPSLLGRIERTVRSIETVRTVSPESPGGERAVAPPVPWSVVERLVPPADAVAEIVARPVSSRPLADTPERAPSARPAPAARTRSAALPPVPRTAGEVRRREAQAVPAEPSVQITIGRLEVTTAAPEPKRERPGRTARPEPAVGLAAFLDRREAT
ncbi:hypothetical protein ABZ490_25340 [Streptomyces sp. NPDC005811]|uniref:hypothetical protein n=1 Tax=Streptomyces sp. NPDC005811 TaxID=3154565 RepID=UPI0033EE4079